MQPAISAIDRHGALEQSERVGGRRIAVARRLTYLAVGAWLLAAILAGALGIVNEPGRPPLVLGTLVAVPILGFVAAYAASPSLRAFTDRIPFSLLIGSHLWRFVGVGFIAAALTGALPAGFGFPEGIGDVIAALGALILLPMVRKGTAPRGWLLAWNTFGFVDLVSALTAGLLFSESALGVLHTTTSNTTLMVTFPVSLIPTFFVPLFLLVHALTFRRIARLGGGSQAVPR